MNADFTQQLFKCFCYLSHDIMFVNMILGLLAENGRIRNLNSIITNYKIIMAAHRGDLQCVVITAKVYYIFKYII